MSQYVYTSENLGGYTLWYCKLICNIKKRQVAHGSFSLHKNEFGNSYGVIRSLDVEQDSRRCKFGTKLLENIESDLRMLGAIEAQLLAYPLDYGISQSELLSFYFKNGYTRVPFWYRIYSFFWNSKWISSNFLVKQLV
jgi:hypothetical protein